MMAVTQRRQPAGGTTGLPPYPNRGFDPMARPIPPAATAQGGERARPASWPSRRHRNHSLKRDVVVRAAARAFNAKGFHNTSLDDIAAALGVSKPTVYYYVESKEQLLFECFQAGLELIREGLRSVEQSPSSARERLNEVVRHYARAVASEFGWCMVRAEDQDLGPELSRHIKSMKAEIDRGIRRLLEQGIAEGSIEPCDTKMTAFAMAGALNWIAHWYRENQPMTAAQLADRFVSVFETGLLPRVPSPGSAAQPG
jgi:AcrR family transcriptional regulator